MHVTDASVDGQPLKVIQGQTQIIGYHLFNRVCVAEACHQILGGILGAQGFKHLHHAMLAFCQ